MQLTPAQQTFVDRYILKGRTVRLEGQHELLKQIATITVPEDATSDEAAAINARLKAGRNLLDDSTSNKELVQAKIDIDAAEALVADALTRIAATRKQAETLKAEAETLPDLLDPEVLAEDRTHVEGAVDRVATAMSGTPKPSDIDDAIKTIQTLKDRIETANAAAEAERKLRAEAALDLISRADKLNGDLDAEASSAETSDFAKGLATLKDTLADPVSAENLETGKLAFADLEKLANTIAERCEADRQRRKQSAAALRDRVTKAAAPSDATEAEKLQLATLATKLDTLAEIPDDETLAQATLDVEALETSAAELEALLVTRRARFAKVAPLLARIASDAAALKPHDRAPAAEAAPISSDAEKLRLSSADMADWANATDLKDSDLADLEKSIVDLETKIAALNKVTTETITKIDAAVKAATDCIAAPKGRAFSAVQKSAFGDLVSVETKKADADLATADPVIAALGEQTRKMQALSLDLAAAERRINAVTLPASDALSSKENAALKTAGDSAKAALDEVAEL